LPYNMKIIDFYMTHGTGAGSVGSATISTSTAAGLWQSKIDIRLVKFAEASTTSATGN
jgi:ABC-type polysaccharide transport system permease subunit